MSTKYAALVDLVLSGARVSREMADLVIAGSADHEEEPVTQVFTRMPVKGELETLISEQLDKEECR